MTSDSQEKTHNYFIFCILLRFTQETLLQRVVSRRNVCRQRGRVVWRDVFTTVMFARLTVQLPPKPRCCVLGQDASQQLSLLGGI